MPDEPATPPLRSGSSSPTTSSGRASPSSSACSSRSRTSSSWRSGASPPSPSRRPLAGAALRGAGAESLQAFVVSYVRYSVQVSGYLHLAASPWPRFGGSDGLSGRRRDRAGAAAVARPGRGSPRARASRRSCSRRVVGGAAFVGRVVGRLDDCDDATWSRRKRASAASPRRPRSSPGSRRSRRGRTPRGLRDLAAYGIAYAAQVARVPPPRHGSLSDDGSRAGCCRSPRFRLIPSGSSSTDRSSARG